MRVNKISIIICVYSIQIVWSMDIPHRTLVISKKGLEKQLKTRVPVLEPLEKEVHTNNNSSLSRIVKDNLNFLRIGNLTRAKTKAHATFRNVRNKFPAMRKVNSRRPKLNAYSNDSSSLSQNKTVNLETVKKFNSTRTKIHDNIVKENVPTVGKDKSTRLKIETHSNLSLTKYRKNYLPLREKVDLPQLKTEIPFKNSPKLSSNLKTIAIRKGNSTRSKTEVHFNHSSVLSRKGKEKIAAAIKVEKMNSNKGIPCNKTNDSSCVSRKSKQNSTAVRKEVNSPRFKTKVHSKDILCLSRNRKDNLPALRKVNSTLLENAIFFIESSCSAQLNARQACSIEAAARANANRSIFVLFPGPISKRCLHSILFSSLRRYSNVNFHKIYPPKFLRNTPLQSLLNNKSIDICDIPAAHVTSDVLKYATLYKYGGIYVDLDMIAVKPFNSLPQPKNWIGKEVDNIIGSAVVSITNDSIGKLVSGTILSLLDDFFVAKQKEQKLWGYYRNGMVTEVLKRLCATTDVSEMTSNNCKGFEVYGSEYFYPVRKTRNYFKKHVGNVPNETFAYYIWNSMYANKEIPSNSLYAYLVNSSCPIVKVVGKYQFSPINV